MGANKYTRMCTICGEQVLAYAGYYHRSETYCFKCYPMAPKGPLPPREKFYVPSSDEVTSWTQATLNLLGCEPTLEVDGLFGYKLKEALAEYQVDNALTITGTPSSETVDRMAKEVLAWNARRQK